jgi:hypothetical protein
MLSAVVVRLTPPAFRTPEPITVPPSRNVTVPVSAPDVEAATVAVNETGCPPTDGFIED